jgi:hypothetical protein
VDEALFTVQGGSQRQKRGFCLFTDAAAEQTPRQSISSKNKDDIKDSHKPQSRASPNLLDQTASSKISEPNRLDPPYPLSRISKSQVSPLENPAAPIKSADPFGVEEIIWQTAFG